jgi:hypothetical protein
VCDDLQHLYVALEQKWRTQKHATVSARNKNCDYKVAQLCTVEFGLHSSANTPYDVVPGWQVTSAVTGNIFVLRVFHDAVSATRFRKGHGDANATTG